MRWEAEISIESFLGPSIFGWRLSDFTAIMDETWSEPLQVDNKLSNFHTWRDVDEEDEATLRPGIQDISSG
jgi:hypothetical protein